MVEVVVQVRLWVLTDDEEEAGELVTGELRSHLDLTFAPDWLDYGIVEVKTVKQFGEGRVTTNGTETTRHRPPRRTTAGPARGSSLLGPVFAIPGGDG